jgi:predicted site-specific integrase-resolvase
METPFIFPDGRMKPDAVAQYTGFDAGTLANWRIKGKGPIFYKRGGRVFYYKVDVDKWLQESGPCVTTAQAEFQLKKMSDI